MQSTKSTTGAG